ncbi:MAG: recombinase family protein, partial [Planctomycetota bacterium]
LHRHGAALVSLTEDLNTGTPMGRAIAKIIAVMAELESEQIGQRVRHALAHLKATGGTRRPGSKQAPFGFQYDASGRLNRLGVEQRAIRKMVRLRMERRWTFGQIAEAMERGGPPLRTGKAWTARTVSRIVHRAVGDAAAVHDARRMNYRTAQRLRRDFRTGRFSFADLAARYNIDRSNAWRIAHGHAWNTPRPFAKRRK